MRPGAIIGRPPIKVDYGKLSLFAKKGLTQKDAATFLGMSQSTFTLRMREDELFAKTWEEGQASCRSTLRTLQWKHAKGRGPAAVSMTIHMSKHMLGETDKSVIEHANKDGKPLEIATRPKEFMGIELATASPEVLAALELIAEATEKAAAAAARDITDEVVAT